MPVGFPLALIFICCDTGLNFWVVEKLSSFYMQIRFQEYFALQNRTGTTFQHFQFIGKTIIQQKKLDRQTDRQTETDSFIYNVLYFKTDSFIYNVLYFIYIFKCIYIYIYIYIHTHIYLSIYMYCIYLIIYLNIYNFLWNLCASIHPSIYLYTVYIYIYIYSKYIDLYT